MKLVGYGASLSDRWRTINGFPKQVEPVYVVGWKRIMNFVYPSDWYKSIEQGNLMPEMGFANALEDVQSKFNAIAFESAKSLRELFYNIENRDNEGHDRSFYSYQQVKVKPFNRSDVALEDAEMLIANPEHVRNNVLPVKSYGLRCRFAAYAISEEFGNVFDSVTFLSDGVRSDGVSFAKFYPPILEKTEYSEEELIRKLGEYIDRTKFWDPRTSPTTKPI